MIHRTATVVIIICMLFTAQNVFCGEKPLWEVGVGAALINMPDYRGSDESRFYFLPYPYLIYRGDILNVERERISGRIFKTDRVLLDVSLFGNVPVDSDDNVARRGMPDLDPTFEIGPSLNITLLDDKPGNYKLSVALPVRAVYATDFSSVHHEGWIFSPRLIFEKNDLISDTGLNLGISAGPMFADSSYHRYFYEVDPVYATPARPTYEAGSGYSGSTLTIGLNKSYKQLVFNAFFSMDFLQGAAIEDSPLVKKKCSLMSGVAVSWVFLKSAKLVPEGR